MNDAVSSENSEAILSAISSLKKKSESKELSAKEKDGVDLVSIVEKLTRNRARKGNK